MTPLVSIENHTTASTPRPHVIYGIQVTADGKQTVVHRRYSEVGHSYCSSADVDRLNCQFVGLHHALGVKDYTLPPKRILVTTFVPSAWVDDKLIAERKSGLTGYLTNVLESQTYRSSSALREFLTPDPTPAVFRTFDLEDALPSTLSRKTALALKAQALEAPANGEVKAAATMIAAAYYPGKLRPLDSAQVE